jgi:hypothetical protein
VTATASGIGSQFIVPLLALGIRLSLAQQAASYEAKILTGLVWRARIAVDSTAPRELRSAAAAYNRRSSAYVPKRRSEPLAEFKMIAPVWAEYERRLVAISSEPNAVALARAYVDSLRPPYEWEGFHDGPEAEARFADTYRMTHPDSPFRELLPLLAAHRWACTEEAYTYERNTAAAARSDTAFRRALNVAVKSSNPLVRVAAEHLGQTHTCDTNR